MILFDVKVGGVSVASKLHPILKSIQTFDGSDNESDSATIILQDKGFGFGFPQKRDRVSIRLGSKKLRVGKVFDGFVDDPRSKGSAKTGAEIHISCKSVDLEGKAKEPQEKHWDNQTLDKILADAFSDTGISLKVDPAFASIKRAFEAMDGRDPLSFAADLASELGATFKAMGPNGVFAQRNSGLSVIGEALTTIEASYGVNLLDWDLAPKIPRSVWSASIARWFDFDEGLWREAEHGLRGQVPLRSTSPRANKDVAGEVASGAGAETEREAGAGFVTILGNWRAQAGARCIVSGLNSAVNKSYIISSVAQNAVKGKGWTTKLELKHIR